MAETPVTQAWEYWLEDGVKSVQKSQNEVSCATLFKISLTGGVGELGQGRPAEGCLKKAFFGSREGKTAGQRIREGRR